MIRALLFVGFWGLLTANPLLMGAVTCPPLFSDNMVIQRGAPVKVWGTATPETTVTVEFAGSSRTTQSNAHGDWSLTMGPFSANTQPQTLSVIGENHLVFENVLVGEVWLCSGQSNMEKPLGEIKGQQPTVNHLEEIAAADYPQIRLFKVPRSGKGLENVAWEACSPESLENTTFSAVGYFFAQHLHQQLEVPVGVIDTSFGGTMIEAWMPEEAFAADPALSDLRQKPYFAWVDGVQAIELFSSMVQPLIPYAIKGFLWYQGESNLMAGDSTIYAKKQIALMTSWRNRWSLPHAPFLFVQLAPFNYSDWTKFPERQTSLAWPAFVEAQSSMAALPDCEMVVTTDLAGSAKDIHPTEKKPVGQRLAKLALLESYGHCQLIARSPRFFEATFGENGTVDLHFTDVGQGLLSTNEQPLSHFQIAGEEGNFVPALATILDRDTVRVSAQNVPDPKAVRFAWDETAQPNLANSARLPAIPFRTDDWPIQTIRPKSTTKSAN